jgi:hypothetical protein
MHISLFIGLALSGNWNADDQGRDGEGKWWHNRSLTVYMHQEETKMNETCHRKLTVDKDVETSNNNHNILTA